MSDPEFEDMLTLRRERQAKSLPPLEHTTAHPDAAARRERLANMVAAKAAMADRPPQLTIWQRIRRWFRL